MNRRWQKLRAFKTGLPSIERGSAVVEFVLVGTPLVLTALAILSVSLSTFSILVLRDSAIEGARYAALADQHSSAGCIRATKIAEAAVGRNTSISCSFRQISGDLEIVELSARLPIVGLLGTWREVAVRGSAPREK